MDDIIRERYLAGDTTTTIAAALGVATETVRLRLMALGIERRTNKVPVHPEFHNLFQALTPVKRIAEILGVSIKVVNRWVRDTGVTRSHGAMVTQGRVIEPPRRDILEDLYRVQQMSLGKIASQYGVSRGTVAKWMRDYDIPITTPEIVRRRASSKKARYGFEHFPPEISTSENERDLLRFLNEDLGGAFASDRSLLTGGFELDGLDVQRRLAVEYCGLYWHSEERGKGRSYHISKYQQCREAGVQLITIFEDEWLRRRDQVRSFLSARLGRFEQRFGARECIVTPNADTSVLTKWHIQGTPQRIEASFALVKDGVPVGLVTFAQHHRNKDVLTLNRLAFRPGTQVVGGASKLVRHALASLDQPIVTWSDNRWSTGELYRNIGFVADADLGPDYSYTDGTSRRSKQSCKKSLIGCPSSVTEREFMAERGWFRIWDCGKRRWQWTP